MALENENGSMASPFTMPVAPMYGGYGMNNGGFGFGGDGLWFLILFFLLAGNGGWGMGGFGGGFGGFAADTMAMYPWMNQSNQIHDGFDHQATRDYLTGIQSAITSGFGDTQLGIAGINQNICQTGNAITGAINSGFNAAESSANARQIANMQQAFAAQTAMNQGFNALQAQQAQCCCDTKAGIADLRYTVATENCADRTAAYQNTRDIIDNQNRVGQSIIDKLCALELDGVKGQLAQAQRDNVALQNQINMANMQIGFNNETDALYNRLKNCPVPTVPVYGSQPIFTCGGNTVGCGCGAVA